MNEPELQQCDILVVGGGPAGSTFSTLMSEMGWKVVLLERDCHPRFHIGESLLPMSLPILERLGVVEEVRAIGIEKFGAEFNFLDGHRETFYFDFAMNKSQPMAYEVRRSEFDEILFRNAARRGVDAREGARVTEVNFRSGRVFATAADRNGQAQHWTARFLIDATGRDTLLSRRLSLKRKSLKHNSAAIFGHFNGVTRRVGKDEGNISIYWFEHGWFWLIPLRDGIVSIGAVCYPEYLKTRSGTTEKFLWDTIALSEGVSARMKTARLVGEVRATGNFSYKATRMYGKKGENYLLVGDSYAFIDPVFSSGVHLAMSAASIAADTVNECLNAPERSTVLLRQYARKINEALKTVSWLIHRFNSPVIYSLFKVPRNDFRMKEAIISLLSGDVYSDTPIRKPLLVFKLIYYITCLGMLPKAWEHQLRRRRNISMIFSGGTTPQDQVES
jgi:flavin-dependent dehydrogenase